MTKFTEERLEQAIIELIEKEKIFEFNSEKINRSLTDVIIKDDLSDYLKIDIRLKKLQTLKLMRLFKLFSL